jgi:hypothetical protein
MGGEGARIEDRPELSYWIRAGRFTLQHPDRYPNASGGPVNGYLSVHALYLSAKTRMAEFGRSLTGRMTCTVIFLPGVMRVLT